MYPRPNYKIPHNFSRSRSPAPSYKQQDFQRKRAKIVSENEELYEKKYDLLEERKKVQGEIKNVKKSIEALEEMLKSYKSNTLIFLPCSHQKLVSLKNRQLLDTTFERALERLTEDELKNEIIIRQIRSKIFYSLENKYPEIFKCTHQEKFINTNCGHTNSAECHEIKKYIKTSQWPPCSTKTEHNFECGHSELIDCGGKSPTKCLRCP